MENYLAINAIVFLCGFFPSSCPARRLLQSIANSHHHSTRREETTDWSLRLATDLLKNDEGEERGKIPDMLTRLILQLSVKLWSGLSGVSDQEQDTDHLERVLVLILAQSQIRTLCFYWFSARLPCDASEAGKKNLYLQHCCRLDTEDLHSNNHLGRFWVAILRRSNGEARDRSWSNVYKWSAIAALEMIIMKTEKPTATRWRCRRSVFRTWSIAGWWWWQRQLLGRLAI